MHEVKLSPTGEAALTRSIARQRIAVECYNAQNRQHQIDATYRETVNRIHADMDDPDDTAFQSECAVQNARRDAVFVEARRVAREHPEWLDAIEPTVRTHFKFIVDNDKYPVMHRGQVIRTDPVPQIDDEFVEWVSQNLEWENRMDQLRVDASLAAHALQNSVARKFLSLTDFDRNAKTGEPNPANSDNVRVFLSMHSLHLRWNEWWQRQEIAKRHPNQERPTAWEPLTDAHIGQLMTQAGDSQHQFRPSEILFRRTLETISRENPFDPVLEYLDEVEARWDRTPRLAAWLAKAVGTPCDPYHQAIGKNVIGGMVKRAREPGAKHDEVMVLIGTQGTYKSTLCRALAWKHELFTDSLSFDGSPQNLVPQMFGKWVIELSEMDGMANREVSFLKAFISRQSDNVTLKYKALATDHGRRCIFIGTSNDDRILRDATGNRRFLPVQVSQRIDVEWVRANLDQLIGEAAALHSAGADFSIPTDVLPAARSHQEAARVEADFETYLEGWFGGQTLPLRILSTDIASLLRDATGRSIPSNRYGVTMRRLGFIDGTPRVNGKPTRAWTRGDGDAPQLVNLHRDTSNRLAPRFTNLAAVQYPEPAAPKRNG